MTTFHCALCGADKPVQHDGGTGYARHTNGDLVCYACCANLDRETLIREGNSRSLPLYLTRDGNKGRRVTNWPGTLNIPVHSFTVSARRRNGRFLPPSRTRTDVWFTGPDGAPWWGFNIGDNDIVHCRRLKQPRSRGARSSV